MVATHPPTLVEAELSTIDPNPWQPRETMDPDELQDLARSIAEVGLLQAPMGRIVNGSRLQLAFGHRRVAAVKLLAAQGQWGGGVPVQVADLSDQDMAILALTENRKRKDLRPIEEYRAWQRALDTIQGLTVQALATSIGLDRSTVANNLRILRLPPVVLDRVDSGDLTARAAREFLAFWAEDHVHEEDMAWVVQTIARDSRPGTPPDWRTENVRRQIRYRVARDHEEAWRPLAPKEGDVEQYGWSAGAAREPAFDVAAFQRDFPTLVHHIPALEAASRLWTCHVREWRRRQAAASREATQAAGGAAAVARKRAGNVRLEVLQRDPVASKVLTPTVSRETAAVAAAQRLKPAMDPPADGEPGEKTRAEGYRRLNEHCRRFVQEHHNEASLKNLAASGPSIWASMQLGTYGLTEKDAADAVANFVRDFRKEIGKELKAAPPAEPTAEDLEKLGSRSKLYNERNRPPFRQDISRNAWSLPFYFDNIEECRTRCTWGASYYVPYRGAGYELVCTNKECWNKKLAGGREKYKAEVAARHEVRDLADEAAARQVLEAGLPAVPALARVLAQLALADPTRPVAPVVLDADKVGHHWRDQQEFGHLPEAAARALRHLGLDPAGHASLGRQAILNAFDGADLQAQVEAAAELAAYALGVQALQREGRA